MKINNRNKLFISFCIFSGSVFLLGVFYHTNPLNPEDDFLKAISTILTTFAGASFAFMLNRQKDVDKEREEKIAALRQASFFLISQHNGLINIWQSLRPWQEKRNRSLAMPAFNTADYSKKVQDFQSLSFLLEEHATLLLKLSIIEERFGQAMFSISTHAEFKLKELAPAVSGALLKLKEKEVENKKSYGYSYKFSYKNAGITIRETSRNFTNSEIEELIGTQIVNHAKNLVDDIFNQIPQTIKAQVETLSEFHKCAKNLFPDEKFLKVKDDLSSEGIV